MPWVKETQETLDMVRRMGRPTEVPYQGYLIRPTVALRWRRALRLREHVRHQQIVVTIERVEGLGADESARNEVRPFADRPDHLAGVDGSPSHRPRGTLKRADSSHFMHVASKWGTAGSQPRYFICTGEPHFLHRTLK